MWLFSCWIENSVLIIAQVNFSATLYQRIITRKMFDRFKSLFTTKSKSVPNDTSSHPAGHYRPMPLAYSFYKGNSYDNTYPSIKAIVNKFIVIRPYAIDANGKPLKESNIVNALYHPNKQMSATDFREALAVMALVHPKVYLLLWRYDGNTAYAGGEITEDNFAGLTFLEGVSEIVSGDKKYYQCGGKTYGEHEVIEIFSGYDPYNLSRGYAPSNAIQKWANVDDYIAAYQAGFFENGAVPAGQFIITAKDKTEFEDIVSKMQNSHRGSGRNNNVVYAHRPIDPATGAATSAQIEWVPFAQSNKDMKIGEIFEQANNKIDSAFGVPASIRGVNDNNTYASVRVDEQIFIKYTVEPFATKIYSRLTHELNRVTGGLGYAITFDLEVPGIADEEKIDAEKKMTEFSLINQAVMSGYSLDSVVDAFGLSKGYKLLKQGYTPLVIVNDKPEVDGGDEVEDAPDSAQLGSADESKFAKPKSGDHHKCTCAHKTYVPTKQEQKLIDDVSSVLRDQMSRQIEQAIDGNELNKDVNDADEEEVSSTVSKVLTILVAYMLLKGKVTYKQGIKLLEDKGVAIDATTEFMVSSLTKANYQAYLMNVATSYASDTANHIRSILAQGQAMEWNKEQIATELRNIMKTDEWRVQRLARTEEHRSSNQASIDAMSQLMNETSTKIYKIWHTNSGDPCEFCAAMEGKRELVNESFLPKGESIVGSNGGVFANTFVDVDAADLHPHCHCYITYEVEND